METFKQYISEIENKNIKEKLVQILKWINQEYPHLEPVIKWNQPMFTHHNTYIIGFSTAKKHLNIAPEKVTLIKFSESIKALGYHQTKMLIQIKENQEVHLELIKKMIDFNIEDKKELTSFWRADG